MRPRVLSETVAGMDDMSTRQLLEVHPFFAGMESRHLDFLVGCATQQGFAANAVLFRYGEPAAPVEFDGEAVRNRCETDKAFGCET